MMYAAVSVVTDTWAEHPVRLWPDHFFASLIIYKVKGVPFALLAMLETTAFDLCALSKRANLERACWSPF